VIARLPLDGITPDRSRTGDSISILLRRDSSARLTHLVHDPRGLKLLQTPEGADEALTIESADGVSNTVRFRVPVLPESLDGIVPEESLPGGKNHEDL
jgi:hypothetical protein